MSPDRIDRLTEKHRECLRLVMLHRTSKEIAPQIGVSSHAVDARLKEACRLLDVSSRYEAARMLAAHERPENYPPLVYQMPDIAADSIAGQSLVSGKGASSETSRHVLREDRTPFGSATLHSRPTDLLLPSEGGRGNDLTAAQRLCLIAIIAIGAAIAFGAIISGLDALTRLT